MQRSHGCRIEARAAVSQGCSRATDPTLTSPPPSQVINQFKPKKNVTSDIVPTVGFMVEEFNKNNLYFTVFDMSGQGRYRDLWSHYFGEAQAIIFVIDSSDRIRMPVAKDELDLLLEHKDIKDSRIPVLFLANKMDLAGALSPIDIVEALQLEKISSKSWRIFATNALTGDGLQDGMDWLAEALR